MDGMEYIFNRWKSCTEYSFYLVDGEGKSKGKMLACRVSKERKRIGYMIDGVYMCKCMFCSINVMVLFSFNYPFYYNFRYKV